MDNDEMWEILGITPGADVQAIRAAYSKKLKKYHPEDDPDGFMRLRSAYKSAIKMAPFKTKDTTVPDYNGETAAQQLDFTGVNNAQPPEIEHQQEADLQTQPLLEFTDVNAQPPETENLQKPDSQRQSSFDFSKLEEDTNERNNEEKQIVDDFINRLKILYKSRKRNDIDEWEALLKQPVVQRLMRSEYFTWEFLEFLAFYISIPYGIRKN